MISIQLFWFAAAVTDLLVTQPPIALLFPDIGLVALPELWASSGICLSRVIWPWADCS